VYALSRSFRVHTQPFSTALLVNIVDVSSANGYFHSVTLIHIQTANKTCLSDEVIELHSTRSNIITEMRQSVAAKVNKNYIQ